MFGAEGEPLLIARLTIAMLSFGRFTLIVCSVHGIWRHAHQLEGIYIYILLPGSIA